MYQFLNIRNMSKLLAFALGKKRGEVFASQHPASPQQPVDEATKIVEELCLDQLGPVAEQQHKQHKYDRGKDRRHAPKLTPLNRLQLGFAGRCLRVL